jgi:hypothetical protein
VCCSRRAARSIRLVVEDVAEDGWILKRTSTGHERLIPLSPWLAGHMLHNVVAAAAVLIDCRRRAVGHVRRTWASMASNT